MKPEQDFYAPWSTQPDEVKPMTREEMRAAARGVRELMEKKGLIRPREPGDQT